MPEFHAEPYIHLAGLSHKSALIAWGAFYFQTRTSGEWKLVDDRDLRHVHPPRRESIGARSDPYGPARVNVYDMSGTLAGTSFTETTNFCWIAGLAADTRYRYEVIVKDETWAEGERWDWTAGTTQGLVQRGGRYVNEFRTHPDPAAEPSGSFTFIVLGDYGTGIRKSTPKRRQREVAEAMQRVFDQHDVRLIITAGDNIYAGNRILGLPVGAQGDEDDDWFFTFFQPYRYMLNRVPVYPCIGNHDTDETEDRDDREQLLDNMYLRERIASDEASGRASLDPGLFYRFRYGRDVEFICLDTSKEGFFRGKRLFEYPKHWEWIEQTFVPAPGVQVAPAVLPPSAVLRGTSAPQHRSHGAAAAAVRSRRRSRGVQRTRAQLPAFVARRDRLLRHRRGQQGAQGRTGRSRGRAHGVVGRRGAFPARDHCRRHHDRAGDWGAVGWRSARPDACDR